MLVIVNRFEILHTEMGYCIESVVSVVRISSGLLPVGLLLSSLCFTNKLSISAKDPAVFSKAAGGSNGGRLA